MAKGNNKFEKIFEKAGVNDILIEKPYTIRTSRFDPSGLLSGANHPAAVNYIQKKTKTDLFYGIGPPTATSLLPSPKNPRLETAQGKQPAFYDGFRWKPLGEGGQTPSYSQV